MKKSLMLVLVFVLLSSFVLAKISIPNVGESIVSVDEARDENNLNSEGINTYFYAGDGLISSEGEGGIMKYYHSDRLGHVRVVSYSDNRDVEKIDYLPFGQIYRNSENSTFKFGGKERDESGLDYFSARYYDPNLGTFTSLDPVASEPPYNYVGNDPLNGADPSGMYDILDWMLMLNDRTFYTEQDSGTNVITFEPGQDAGVYQYLMNDNTIATKGTKVGADGKHYLYQKTAGGGLIVAEITASAAQFFNENEIVAVNGVITDTGFEWSGGTLVTYTKGKLSITVHVQKSGSSSTQDSGGRQGALDPITKTSSSGWTRAAAVTYEKSIKGYDIETIVTALHSYGRNNVDTNPFSTDNSMKKVGGTIKIKDFVGRMNLIVSGMMKEGTNSYGRTDSWSAGAKVEKLFYGVLVGAGINYNSMINAPNLGEEYGVRGLGYSVSASRKINVYGLLGNLGASYQNGPSGDSVSLRFSAGF
jgi:RHS repeat-associated protein